jgi:RNA polymerase sigma-70 factor (ECF subfamily)
MNNDERALAERAQTSAEGFGELYDRYYERIYNFACRRTSNPDEAADVTATVFHDALVHIRDFEYRNVPVSAWLYRIASRRLADYYRRQYRAEQVDLATVESLPADDADPAEALLGHERREVVNRALDELPERDQMVLSLVFFEDLSREQVATIMGTSVDNVYVWLHRALKRLRRQLSTEVTYV